MARNYDSKDGTPYPSDWGARRDELEALQDAVETLAGERLGIVSAYRPPEYNAKIGGAGQSQHMYGRALDLKPYKITVTVLHQRVLAASQAGKLPTLGGLGFYGDGKWIHVDTRPHSKLVRWNGPKAVITPIQEQDSDEENTSGLVLLGTSVALALGALWYKYGRHLG